ncbi:putative reverse transcriptase domain-containing protein [Tanacetum coccineum]
MKNWKVPKTPSEIRSFLGLVGYYRRSIANFSKIAKPLTSLTQKDQKYEWGVEQKEAFQTLKDNLCNAPILSLPEGSEDFVVYCDASNQRFGCVLMQRGKVIAYASRQLKIHEKNYTTHDLELRAMKELNMRQRRWIELFSDYDYEIRYHLGKANVVADALSRKERMKPRRKEDGGLYFMDRIWVPLVGSVRTLIMDKAHASRLSRSSSRNDTNWLIVDRLTKSTYFLAIREGYKTEMLATLYIDEIVAGHEVPVSIISDRNRRFTSRVLANITKSLRDAIGYDYEILEDLSKELCDDLEV